MYKGIFWCYWPEGSDPFDDTPKIITTRVLCDADGVEQEEVEYSSKANGNFNHEKEWRKKSEDITFNFRKLPYNYFPRGRVEINQGRIKVFANPVIVGNIAAKESIVEQFELKNKEEEIRWKADNSKHYQYINEYYSKDFDFRWNTKFGPPRTEVFTWDEFDAWMKEIIRWDWESEE